MRGKNIFTEDEANKIRELLISKVVSTTSEQKIIRGRLRRQYKFYIRDFTDQNGFTVNDFNELIEFGRITIIS